MKKFKLDLQMFAGYRGQDISFLKLALTTAPSTALLGTKGDLSISVSNPEIDLTDDASLGAYEFIPGDQSATITGSFNYLKQADANATAQQILITASYTQAKLYLTWAYETTASTGIDYDAVGYVTDCSSTKGDPQTMSFTIKISGAITPGTQTA